MEVLIVLGDQDGYHEAEHEVVSSPIWLSEILADEGLECVFLLQARRAEILLEQRRDDVIAAIRRHEIGLHGRDLHPNLPEAVEGLGWDDGVEAVLAIEQRELALLGRVFDRAPLCSSEHRRLGAPQLYGAMRRLGLPYLFGPAAAPPTHSLSWFAGALSVPFDAAYATPEFLGFFPAVFDDALPDDAAFAALFGRLRRHVERGLEVGLPLLSVFVCHPERLCYAGPLERWQYGNGRNRDRAAVPPGAEARRDRAEVERALANFRTLVRYLRDAPGLEPTTVADLVRRYGHQPATLSRGELVAAAEATLPARQIAVGPASAFSPAELLLGWADALVAGAARERTPRREVLGPAEAPPLAPEQPFLSSSQLVGLARELVAYGEANGRLPSALALGGAPVGLGMLYGALARTYLALAREGGPPDEVELDVWPRYPAVAAGLDREFRRCAEDPLARPGLSTDAMALQGRLQSWTLKAAMRSA